MKHPERAVLTQITPRGREAYPPVGSSFALPSGNTPDGSSSFSAAVATHETALGVPKSQDHKLHFTQREFCAKSRCERERAGRVRAIFPKKCESFGNPTGTWVGPERREREYKQIRVLWSSAEPSGRSRARVAELRCC